MRLPRLRQGVQHCKHATFLILRHFLHKGLTPPVCAEHNARMSDDFQLHLSSSARVQLQLRVAGMGNRSLAYLLDLSIVATIWLTLALLITGLFTGLLDRLLNMSSLYQALLTVLAFVLTTGYDIFFESFYDGQTPGKKWLGLRVVRVDGARLGFFDSAIRNLLRVVDILPGGYGIGIISMAASRQQRRLGDWVSACVVVRETDEPDDVNLAKILQKAENDPACAVALRDRQVTTEAGRLVEDFFRRQHHFSPVAREQLARQLLIALAGPFDDEAWELDGLERIECMLAALLRDASEP